MRDSAILSNSTLFSRTSFVNGFLKMKIQKSRWVFRIRANYQCGYIIELFIQLSISIFHKISYSGFNAFRNYPIPGQSDSISFGFPYLRIPERYTTKRIAFLRFRYQSQSNPSIRNSQLILSFKNPILLQQGAQ